jgi:predicted RecB family nuclease
MTPDDQYRLLVDALRLVAAAPETQIAMLPDFVCVTDEVATTFGDAYLLIPQLRQAALVSSDAAEAIKRLDDFLGSMPADESLAETESRNTHDAWAEARVLAADALRLLDEEERPPDLSGKTWVKGE